MVGGTVFHKLYFNTLYVLGWCENTCVDSEWGTGGPDLTLENNKLLCFLRNYSTRGGSRGFICIKVWGFALLMLSHFS